MIDVSIWDELSDLSAHAQHVYMWSFANTRTNLCGIFKVRREIIELETKVTGGELDAALAELSASDRLHYDGEWMFIRSRTKQLSTRTIQFAKSVVRGVRDVPDAHPYRLRWLEIYGDESWLAIAEIATLTRGSGDTHHKHDSQAESTDTHPTLGRVLRKRRSVIEPSTSLKTKDPSLQKIEDEADRIYALIDREYPKPIGKKSAAVRLAAQERALTGDTADRIAATLAVWRSCERWQESRWIPDPENFLLKPDYRRAPDGKPAPTAADAERLAALAGWAS